MVPNAERHIYRMQDWSNAQKQISIATISSDDLNWDALATLPNLEELTLHAPSNEQMEFVSQLWRLKRLRITHARPRNIEFISRLQNLEELILEYVSGFDDVSPVGGLTRLHALHFENLRRVSNFSGLAGSRNLRFLSISGTLDWAQPVDSFDFLRSLTELEYLTLHLFKAPKVDQPLSSLMDLKKLTKLNVGINSFPLEVFAWLEAKLPNVQGVVRPAFVKFGGKDEEVDATDIRARLPLEQLGQFSNLFEGEDGKRYVRIPHQALLLGKGQRGPIGNLETVDRVCQLHEAKYRELVEKFTFT